MTPSEGLAQVAEKLPELLATLTNRLCGLPLCTVGHLTRGLLAELIGQCLGVQRLK